MTTINNHKLPSKITINGVEYAITNWSENGSMDGFVGNLSGLPIDDYKDSESIEFVIWQENQLNTDVYADGTGTVSVAI